MIPSLSIKLLAVTTTVLSLISYECHAQLFPWSNLKHYFDQKTKDGPGNGGVLTLAEDQSAESDSHHPSSTELLDSFDDSSTASTISKHNHKNIHTPFSLDSLSTYSPPYVEQRVRNHAHKPKPSRVSVRNEQKSVGNHQGYDEDSDQQTFFPHQQSEDKRVNVRKQSSVGNHHSYEDSDQQTFFPRQQSEDKKVNVRNEQKQSGVINHHSYEDSDDQTFFPQPSEGKRVTSLKSDESFRKRGSKPPRHQGELISYTTPSPILITQKPVVLVDDNEDAHKRRLVLNRASSQHKSVSIMPSSSLTIGEGENGRINVGLNSQQTQNPSLFITPRPTLVSSSVPSFNDDVNVNTNSKKIHKPKRQRPVRPGYSNVGSSGKEVVKRIKKPNLGLSKNNDYSSTRSPLFVTPGPNSVSSVAPQQDLYPFARPNNNGEKLIVESVPSISIALKPSNNNNGATNIRPIFVGGDENGNLGLVDYLVPPRISQTFQDVRPVGNQNVFNDDKSIENEMTRLKPPLATNVPFSRPKKINTNKKVNDDDKINNHNLRNHNTRVPNKQRNKFHNHKMTQAVEVSPTENVNLNYNNHHQAADPSYTDLSPTRNENLMKKHNSGHHKPAPTYTDLSPTRKQNLMKNHNNDHHHEAASHIDEQISSETGFLRNPSHHSTGERVEFQMHGQNGPKSYKFGYDTGKGHNRQFRYEERDKDGHVKGHYGYYDKDGKLQVVNYEADPETGFKANPVDMSPDQN